MTTRAADQPSLSLARPTTQTVENVLYIAPHTRCPDSRIRGSPGSSDVLVQSLHGFCAQMVTRFSSGLSC